MPAQQLDSRRPRRWALLSTSLALLVTVGMSGCVSSAGTEAPAPTSPTSVTSPPQPTEPSTAGSSSTSTRPKSSQPGGAASGSSAVFRHFKVAVSQIERRADLTVVRAEVCVRSLPPDPQGNRTRISWNPWSVRAGKQDVDPALDGGNIKKMFPKSATYAVGDCASGWIPFPTTAEIGEISYENGVGDRAVWDADRLAQPPTKGQASGGGSKAPSTGIGEGTFIVNDDVRPGRYKARAAAGGTCYWARLKDDSGEADSIIANNITEGSAVVTIKSSDGAFETRGCTPWVRQ